MKDRLKGSDLPIGILIQQTSLRPMQLHWDLCLNGARKSQHPALLRSDLGFETSNLNSSEGISDPKDFSGGGGGLQQPPGPLPLKAELETPLKLFLHWTTYLLRPALWGFGALEFLIASHNWDGKRPWKLFPPWAPESLGQLWNPGPHSLMPKCFSCGINS